MAQAVKAEADSRKTQGTTQLEQNLNWSEKDEIFLTYEHTRFSV